MQKSQYVCGVNLNTEIMKKLIKKRNINFLILIILSFMALSCGTTKKYYSADFEKLNHKIDGKFYNYQYDVSQYHRGRHSQHHRHLLW